MKFDAGTEKERVLHRISRVEDGVHLMLDLLVVNDLLRPAWEDRTEIDLGDAKLWSVSTAGLAHLKRISNRPQDIADLQKLGLD